MISGEDSDGGSNSGSGGASGGSGSGGTEESVNPSPFTFVDSLSASPNVIYTGSVTVSGLGIGKTATATITAGTFFKNGVTVGAMTTTVQNGDVLGITLTASATLNAKVSSVLTIGTISDSFDVQTMSFTPDFVVSTSRGNNTTGDGSMANPYKTITKALGLSAALVMNKTIYVERGAYTENLTVSKTGITLVGENPANTVIVNSGTSSNTFTVNSPSFTVKNFTIRNTDISAGWVPVYIAATGVYVSGVVTRFLNNIVAYHGRGVQGGSAMNTNFPSANGNNIFWGNGSANVYYTNTATDKSSSPLFSNCTSSTVCTTPNGVTLNSGSPAFDSGTGTLAGYGLSTSSYTAAAATADTSTIDIGVHFNP